MTTDHHRSRLLHGDSDSSDSSSDYDSSSDSNSSSSDVPTNQQQKPKLRSRAALMSDDSDSESEKRRVVRSAVDKRWTALKSHINALAAARKVGDFGACTARIDDLVHSLQKAQGLLQNEGWPRWLIRPLVETLDYAQAKFEDKPWVKQLTKTKAHAFNVFRSKLRKSLEQPYKDIIQRWRDEPSSFQKGQEEESSSLSSSGSDTSDASDDSSDESSEASSDASSDGMTSKPKKGLSPVKKGGKKQVSSDDSDGLSGSSDESSSDEDGKKSSLDSSSVSSSQQISGKHKKTSDDDSDNKNSSDSSDWGSSSDSESDNEVVEKTIPGPSRWLKSNTAAAGAQKKGLQLQKAKEKQQKQAKKEGGTEKTKETAVVQLRGRDQPLFGPDDIIDEAAMERRLQELVAARGRKGHDRNELIKHLSELAQIARDKFGPQMELNILAHLIAAYFDATMGVFVAMAASQWIAVHGEIGRALTLISSDPTLFFPVVLSEDDEDEDDVESNEDAPMAHEDSRSTTSLLKKAKMAGGGGSRIVRATRETALLLTRFLQRLDDEVTKSLQFTDVHAAEFKLRLGHTVDVLVLLWHAFSHFLRVGQQEAACILSLRILEHVYYKRDNLCDRLWELVGQRLPPEIAPEVTQRTPAQILTQLLELNLRNVAFGSQEGDCKVAVRCVLYGAFHHALHGKYHRARDLLALGALHEQAIKCSISTQILYNRVLVQLGLAAFRHGLIAEAYGFLSEVCAMGRFRELLAQGFSSQRGIEKTHEQESLEKRRLLPYQMHIPSDLVEAVHNITAMLLEVPAMAAPKSADRTRPRAIAKNFRKLLDAYDRQVLTGPPESQRDHIMAATKALQAGDWKSCCDNLDQVNIWQLLPDAANVKEIIFHKVKQEALRTYIYTHSGLYESFCVNRLSDQFALKFEDVASVINGMLVQGTLTGCWGVEGQFVLLTRTDRTPLQIQAAGLMEKVGQAISLRETLEACRNPRFLQQVANKEERRRFDEDHSRAPTSFRPPVARYVAPRLFANRTPNTQQRVRRW